MKKKEYRELLKKINSINVSNICKKNHISRQNIYECTAKNEDLDFVIYEIFKQIDECKYIFLNYRFDLDMDIECFKIDNFDNLTIK